MKTWNRIMKEMVSSLAKGHSGNQPQRGGDVAFYNAQSWNPETHPKGRGDSYLVQDVSYDAKSGKMDVTYRDGFTAEYDNIQPQQAQEFARADSKGRWALKHLWKLPYRGV